MERRCAACDEWLSYSHFSRNQRKKGEGHSRCKDCVGNPPPPPTPLIQAQDPSYSRLQILNNLTASGTFTYDGWDADAFEAEDCLMNRTLFDGNLEKMRRKQASHVGDRSHPQLQMLDNLRVELTYNGWEADVRRAENALYFDEYIEKIRKKQNIHTTQQNALRLAERAPLQPRARHIDDSQNLTAGIQDDKVCAVCWFEKKAHAFVACGHKFVCLGCVEKILSGNSMCPLKL